MILLLFGCWIDAIDATDPASCEATAESCNGEDDDCDGQIDEGVMAGGYEDDDGDGWGEEEDWVQACELPADVVDRAGDCDDLNPSVHPEAVEVTGDGIDQDCDGQELCLEDQDNDGAVSGGTVVSEDLDCMDIGEAPSTATELDCDDDDADVNPQAQEICDDGVDNDCSGDHLSCLMSGTYRVQDAALGWEGGPADGLAYDVAVGDLTGDGLAEVILGTYSSDAVVAYAFRGPPSGDLSGATAKVVDEGSLAGARVAVVPDVDGDGLAELFVTHYQGGPQGEGALYRFSGLASGTVDLDTAEGVLVGEAPGDMASEVAGLGDIDGDGLGDLVVGAWDAAPGNMAHAGAAYLVLGPVTSTERLSQPWTGEDIGGLAGIAVAGADLDGDGREDMVVAAQETDRAGDDSGAVYLLREPEGGGLLTDADAVLEGQAGSRFGSALATGDVDGDGQADLVVGANCAGTGCTGAAWVFAGPIDGVVGLGDATAELRGAQPDDRAGYAIGVGDLDGDGVEDVVMTALYTDEGGSDGGAVYIAYGPPAGTLYATDLPRLLGSEGQALGNNVAVGDVDGDGKEDLVVGALGDGGSAWLWMGQGF